MSFQIIDNLFLGKAKFLDSRVEYATIHDMKVAFGEMQDYYIPTGLIAWVTETKANYIFDKDNSVDETLGKWREYNPAKAYVDASPNYKGGYYYNNNFYSDTEHTSVIAKEDKKLYIDYTYTTNDDYTTYMCDGSNYMRIGITDVYTKSDADNRFAAKVHTHTADDIKSESYMPTAEMEEILNTEA